MPTPSGVWVEYEPAENRDGIITPDTIIRPFSSEIGALRSATANGNRALFVEFGETIEQAFAREHSVPVGATSDDEYLTGDPTPAPTPTPKRRTAAERRIANGTIGDEAVNPPEDAA